MPVIRGCDELMYIFVKCLCMVGVVLKLQARQLNSFIMDHETCQVSCCVVLRAGKDAD